MQRITKKIKTVLLVFSLVFAAFTASTVFTAAEVQAAAKNGFYTENGVTYYYRNGKKVTGSRTINGKKYFFLRSGRQVNGWYNTGGKKYYYNKSTNPLDRYLTIGWKTINGKKYYFDAKGVMVKGFYTIGSKTYYFSTRNGAMVKGWLKLNGDRYYFSSAGVMYKNKMTHDSKRDKYRYFGGDGKLARGWTSFSGGDRYFTTDLKTVGNDGIMAVGFTEIDGNTYYFSTEKATIGYKKTGWITRTSDGAQFYLDPDNRGIMVTDTKKVIGGVTYTFDKDGVATAEYQSNVTTGPTGTKTIKNYLRGALLPVGKALYVWGGGWTQSTVKGVAPEWVKWYESQDASYNYNNYRDLTVGNRIKGLDCSGFVGWTAYQVMHTKSGEGYGYTVVSGSIGSSYVSRGWGTIITQADLAGSGYKICPGDVGYNSGHTWIMLGQCKDKSCVIIHSTPNAGVQIAGTPTPEGNYSSQAVVLAKKYMAHYAGYNGKYAGCYKPSTGNFIKNGNFLRWNRTTLADPDGYMNKTADQILYDLFGF